MSYIKSLMKQGKKALDHANKIKLRKHLNADALFNTLRKGFDKIDDHRKGTTEISLTDVLMSGFAFFSLKDPSVLAFDERRPKGPQNLMSIYGIGKIPCDTSMRGILDDVGPNDLRPLFKDAFRQLQRGKVLEKMTFYGITKKFNLDFYCKSFGIESPKSHGVSGMDVKELYNAGKIKEIATYCGHDVKATYELYKIWDEYLNL